MRLFSERISCVRTIREFTVWIILNRTYFGRDRFPASTQRFYNVASISWRSYNVMSTSIRYEIIQRLHKRRCMTFIQCRIDVDATSWRCIDVYATLYKRHVPAGLSITVATYKWKRWINIIYSRNILISLFSFLIKYRSLSHFSIT